MNFQTFLNPILEDPQVTDICINGNSQIYVDRGHGMEPVAIGEQVAWNAEDLRSWVLDQLSLAGKSWDAKHPFVDATLRTGFRIHVAFPPISPSGILVSLRRLPRCSETKRWSQSPLYAQLAKIVRQGDSMILCGATGSGKTTLATDLISEVLPSERIVALEDTPELHPSHPHFISLLSRPPNADGCGEVTLRILLKQTLRMRPDRIILGECRGAEVLDLLQALNTGHRGAMATLHANSARDALKRIELLCLLAAQGQLSSSVIRDLLASGIQWICYVHRHLGTRKISELWKIEGREGDTILMRPMVESPHERIPRDLVSQNERPNQRSSAISAVLGAG